MKKYKVTAGSTERLEFGIAFAAKLRAVEETRMLGAPVDEVNDRLEIAKRERVSARKPVVAAHATLEVVELATDGLIRSFARVVEVTEGGRRGPLFAELFPEGVTPVVQPRGPRQLETADELVDRLERSLNAGADELRASWLSRLREQVATLRGSVAGMEEATGSYGRAFANETAVRLEHRRVVDGVGGQVRTTFPNDRRRQDAVFPRRDDRRRGNGDAGAADEPQPPGPSAEDVVGPATPPGDT